MSKIIELLENNSKILHRIYDEEDLPMPDDMESLSANNHQALDFLKQQPTAGEWTKSMRNKWLPKPINIDRILSEAVSTITVACDRLDSAEARSIDCPNRPASKTEVEMAKRLCDYQDEVHELKQRISNIPTKEPNNETDTINTR